MASDEKLVPFIGYFKEWLLTEVRLFAAPGCFFGLMTKQIIRYSGRLMVCLRIRLIRMHSAWVFLIFEANRASEQMSKSHAKSLRIDVKGTSIPKRKENDVWMRKADNIPARYTVSHRVLRIYFPTFLRIGLCTVHTNKESKYVVNRMTGWVFKWRKGGFVGTKAKCGVVLGSEFS